MSDHRLRANIASTFAIALVMAAIASVNLAAFLGAKCTLAFGVGAGAAAGVGWVATSIGTTYAFGRRPLALSFTLMRCPRRMAFLQQKLSGR